MALKRLLVLSLLQKIVLIHTSLIVKKKYFELGWFGVFLHGKCPWRKF